MSSANVEIVKRLWEAWEKGGSEAILEVVDRDVVWAPFGAGGHELRGYDELADYLAHRSEVLTAEPYEYQDLGDCVLVTGHIRQRDGTALVDSQLEWLYTFRDERLVRFEAFAGPREALEAAEAQGGGSGD